MNSNVILFSVYCLVVIIELSKSNNIYQRDGSDYFLLIIKIRIGKKRNMKNTLKYIDKRLKLVCF